MITITYYRNENRVIVNGHAQSGEVGHDLVCASVSILVYTLAAFVRNMEAARQTKCPTVKLGDGQAFIYCNAPKKYKTSVTLAFDTVCAGFELLAHDYPKNISFEIRE